MGGSSSTVLTDKAHPGFTPGCSRQTRGPRAASGPPHLILGQQHREAVSHKPGPTCWAGLGSKREVGKGQFQGEGEPKRGLCPACLGWPASLPSSHSSNSSRAPAPHRPRPKRYRHRANKTGSAPPFGSSRGNAVETVPDAKAQIRVVADDDESVEAGPGETPLKDRRRDLQAAQRGGRGEGHSQQSAQPGQGPEGGGEGPAPSPGWGPRPGPETGK